MEHGLFVFNYAQEADALDSRLLPFILILAVKAAKRKNINWVAEHIHVDKMRRRKPECPEEYIFVQGSRGINYGEEYSAVKGSMG